MVTKKNGKKKPGRHTKLTPDIQSEIVELLKAGNYIDTACGVAGISKKTFYEWMKKANASNRSNRYTVFRNAVKKAQCWSEARDVAIIARHSEESWQASAWRLERKFPDKWGRQKLEVEHSGKIESSVSHIDETDREVIKRALAQVAQRAKETPMVDEDEDDEDY